MRGLFLEEVFESLASVGVARRAGRGCGASSVRLSVRGRSRILLDGHAEFVEGASVLGIFGRNAFLDRLSTFELRAGVEETALFAAVQFSLALGTRAIGIKAWGEDGTAIGAAGARDSAYHARSTGTELVGAARTARGGLAIVVRLVFLILFFRIAVTAVTVLSIHKRLRPPVSTDCHNYNLCFCAVALANLACIQSDCYTRPDGALNP